MVLSLSCRILRRVETANQVRRRKTPRTLRAAGVLASLVVTAACTAQSAAVPGPASSTPSAVRAKATASPATASPAAPADTGPPRITFAQVRTADGSVVTLATFHGAVRYVLHNGSQDPGPAYAHLVQAGPAVTGTERQHLLAAFNGGFKMRSRAGGYEQEGHVFRALRTGLASLVIDRSGHARIGVWGAGTPAPGEAVYSVRQNLWPLVMNGQPTAESARWQRWGGTVAHAEYAARSALGQNAAGDLIFAASMSTIPADLASALARSGARIAMELDINQEWVQMDSASTPGGPLTARVPGQVRPAGQYLTGWTRDFFTVLAP
jgi:predicted secreted protein